HRRPAGERWKQYDKCAFGEIAGRPQAIQRVYPGRCARKIKYTFSLSGSPMKILSLLLRTWLPSAMCCAAILPPLFAQTPNTSFAAPRLKNGQPDLQGLWKLVASGPPPRAGSGIFAGMEYL